MAERVDIGMDRCCEDCAYRVAQDCLGPGQYECYAPKPKCAESYYVVKNDDGLWGYVDSARKWNHIYWCGLHKSVG
jgi:hypothetical protein